MAQSYFVFWNKYQCHLSKQVLLQMKSFNPELTVILVLAIKNSLFIFRLSAWWPNVNLSLFLPAKRHRACPCVAQPICALGKSIHFNISLGKMLQRKIHICSKGK